MWRSDSEDSSRIRKTEAVDPMRLENGTFTFTISNKKEVFDFPEAIFWHFPQNFKNSYYASLLVFSKRFLAWTTSEDAN